MPYTPVRISRQGFTLIELLVAVLLTGLVTTAVYGVYRVQTHSMKRQEHRREAHEYARAALDLMVREIRNAAYDPTGSNCAEIEKAESQKIKFSFDANANGSCGDPGEKITYRLLPGGCPAGHGDITRKPAGGSEEPMTDCNIPTTAGFFSLNYYPKDSSTPYTTPVSPSDRPNIQRVSISITVESKTPDPQFGSQLNATMTSNVDLRNRGLPP